MSNTISYFTKEGFEKLKEELHQLKTKGRADMAKQIQEARDKGDLSENAEYDAAKDAQGMLEIRSHAWSKPWRLRGSWMNLKLI